MKINYTLDDTNRIIEWRVFPFDESKPWLEINSPEDIVIGSTGVVDGKLVELGKSQEQLQYEQSVQLQQEMECLKANLAEDDYKIIKCYEAQIVGSTMPYNIHELITKRDDYRKRINEIEQTLQELSDLNTDDYEVVK